MKKKLFIYVDFNFSFRIGHYLNIFNNIYNYLDGSEEDDFLLIHDYWEHFNEDDEKKFKAYPNLQKALVPIDFLTNYFTINGSKLEKYKQVTFYIYKGGIEQIEIFNELSQCISKFNIDFKLYLTTFIIPFKELNLEKNEFSRTYLPIIKKCKDITDKNSRIQLCFDMPNSIWNKYFPNIVYLAPPLLSDIKYKINNNSTKNRERIIIGLDLWNLSSNPLHRYEHVDFIAEYIEGVISKYENVIFRLKLMDSSYIIKDNDHPIFFHKNVEILRYLNPTDYTKFLKSCDLYLLQYSPTYYKNKSSGHFIELLLHNVLIIGTVDTFLEKVINELQIGVSYKFGNLKKLHSRTVEALKNIDFFQENFETNEGKIKQIIQPWTVSHFFKKIKHRIILPKKSFAMKNNTNTVLKELKPINSQETKILNPLTIQEIYHFKGDNYLEEKEGNRINRLFSVLKEYKFEICVKPRYNASSFQETSNVAPAMPLLLGPICIYDYGPKIQIGIKTGQNQRLQIVQIENDLEWINIQVYQNLNSNTIKISVNGKVLFSSVNKLAYQFPRIKLGIGYMERLWKGYLGRFSITSNNGEKVLEISNPKQLNQYFNEIQVDRNKIMASITKQPTNSLTISVITPSYNQAQFLDFCLKSVKNQSIKPIDHIIIDPGSKDNSRDKVREFAKTNKYVQTIFEPDEGQSDAINKGFAKAQGDILVWLNSDDMFYDRDTFKKVIEAFNTSKADIVYGKAIFVDDNGQFLRNGFVNPKSNSLLSTFEHQVGIIQPSVFIKKEVFDKVGGPPLDMDYTLDYEYWVRIAKAGFKWHYVGEIFSKHRWWSDMKTAGKREESLLEHLTTVKKHFGYVHYLWAERLAECRVNKLDGIINNPNLDERKNSIEVEALIKDLLIEYNTDYETLKILGNSQDASKKETLQKMKALGINTTTFCLPYSDKLKMNKSFFTNEDAKLPMAWRNYQAKLNDKLYVGYEVNDGFHWLFDKHWFDYQMNRSKIKIEELKKKRKSDECIIVGNGPSLNKTNFDVFKKYDTIICNFAYYNEELRAQATYYTTTNRLVASQCNHELKQIKSNTIKFFPYWLSPFYPQDENTYFLNANLKNKFSEDVTEWVSWRSTVSYFNLQLAFSLGYKKVYLVGFDNNYKQDDKLKEGDLIDQKGDDENHFDPRYFKGKQWQAADVNAMENVYKVAKGAYSKNNRKIINATVGGKLEVFNRTNITEKNIFNKK